MHWLQVKQTNQIFIFQSHCKYVNQHCDPWGMELVMMANPKSGNAPSVVVFLIQFPPPSLSHCGGGEGKVCSSGIFDTFFRAFLAFEDSGNTTFPAHKERLIQTNSAGRNATSVPKMRGKVPRAFKTTRQNNGRWNHIIRKQSTCYLVQILEV